MSDAILATINSGNIRGVDDTGTIAGKNTHKYPVYPNEYVSSGDFVELVDKRKNAKNKGASKIINEVDWTKSFVRLDKDTVVKISVGPGEAIDIPQDIIAEYIGESRHTTRVTAKEYIAEYYDNEHNLKKRVERNISTYIWSEISNSYGVRVDLTAYMFRTLTIYEYNNTKTIKTVRNDLLKKRYDRGSSKIIDNQTTIIYSDRKDSNNNWVPIDNLKTGKSVGDTQAVVKTCMAETGFDAAVNDNGVHTGVTDVSAIQQKEGLIVAIEQSSEYRRRSGVGADPDCHEIFINAIYIRSDNIFVYNFPISFLTKIVYAMEDSNVDIYRVSENSAIITVYRSYISRNFYNHLIEDAYVRAFFINYSEDDFKEPSEIRWIDNDLSSTAQILETHDEIFHFFLHQPQCPKLIIGSSNTFMIGNKKCVAVAFNGIYRLDYPEDFEIFSSKLIINIYDITSETPKLLNQTSVDQSSELTRVEISEQNVQCTSYTYLNSVYLKVLSTSQSRGTLYTFKVQSNGAATLSQKYVVNNFNVSTELIANTPYYNNRMQMYELPTATSNPCLIVCNPTRYAQAAIFFSNILSTPAAHLPEGFTAPKYATKLQEMHLEEGHVVILELVDKFTGQSVQLCVNLTKYTISYDIPTVTRYVRAVNYTNQTVHGLSLQNGYSESIVKVALGKNKEA